MNIYAAMAIFLSALMTADVLAEEVSPYEQQKNYCLTNLPASRPQCDVLIKQLESDGSAVAMVTLGQVYSGFLLRNKEPENVSLLKKKITLAFDAALALEPNNVAALYGRTVDAPRTKKLSLLRRILAIEPKNEATIQTLAQALFNGNESEYKAGIALLMKSYPLFQGNTRLVLAAKLYEALRFKKILTTASIIQGEGFKMVGIDVEQNTHQQAIDQLHLSCSYWSSRFDGIKLCLNSVLLVVNQGVVTSQRLHNDSPKLLKALKILMPNRYELQKELSNVSLQLRDVFEDMKQAGEQPLAFYLMYADIVTGRRQIAALKKAIALTPDKPAVAALKLAGIYMSTQRYNKAEKLYADVVNNGLPKYAKKAAAGLKSAQKYSAMVEIYRQKQLEKDNRQR